MIRKRRCVPCTHASPWASAREVGVVAAWTPKSRIDRMSQRMLGSLTWASGAGEQIMKTSKIQVDYNHCIITGLAMLKSARRIMVGAFYSFRNDLPDAKAVFPPSPLDDWGKNFNCHLCSLLDI